MMIKLVSHDRNLQPFGLGEVDHVRRPSTLSVPEGYQSIRYIRHLFIPDRTGSFAVCLPVSRILLTE